MRGSAKHVLDLLECEDYVQVMNGLLLEGGASIAHTDEHRPLDKHDPAEWSADAFCAQFCRDWFDVDRLTGWWPQVMPPQWDLISTCRVDGQPGLLLTEAKAHEGECSTAAKELEPGASPESKRNHRQIRRCLREAQDSLNRVFDGPFRLSTDSHYQLANRVAYLWKLASLGIPTVLLYLGFTGDTYFERDYLRNADHWQRVMGAYMQDVVPLSFPGRVVKVSEQGSAQMIIRSLPVLQGTGD
jgi:hypothetical protein